ncbi:MAG: DUF4270 domain-containing protein [Rikenellaceae bacterium]|nr:DUF4270 domain-containing protein [Rikenellaceae bacterium]
MLNFMTGYSNRIFRKVLKFTVFATLAGLFIICLISSCVTRDDTFGQGFIPDDQSIFMKVDSTFIVKTYNVKTDSIESSGFTKVYLGSKSDPYTGDMNAESIFQLSAPYFYYDYKFGTDAVIDSMHFIVHISDSMGKPGVEQIFEVYDMTEYVHLDSIYYTDFDPSGIIESTPRFEFKNTVNAEGYIYHKLDDPDLMKELLDTTGYSFDTVFRNRFKGWYVKPKSKVDGAVYELDLANSYLSVNYHNFNETPDTSIVLYRLAPTNYSNYELVPFSQSVSIINYDYTNADPDLRIEDTINPVSKTFIQAYGGLATLLEFSQESIDKIKADVQTAGYSHLVINKAKLEVRYPDVNYVELERHLFSRLGIYTDIMEYESIPDYDYMLESYGYTTRYGGYVNRSRDMYEMDITMYVQRLFRDDYNLRKVTLGPSVEEFNTMNFLELDGFGSENPPLLIITYTMIR